MNTTSPPDKIIGECRSYDELVAALRARCRELGQSYEVIGEIAGVPLRYLNKVFAPIPIKNLGRISLGPVLGALGLKLIVAEDAEMLARIKRHSIWNHQPNASKPTVKRRKRQAFRGNSEWGRLMRHRGVALSSPQQRSRAASKASKARWRRARTAASAAPHRQNGDGATRGTA